MLSRSRQGFDGPRKMTATGDVGLGGVKIFIDLPLGLLFL
jgi:hypothetical protein